MRYILTFLSTAVLLGQVSPVQAQDATKAGSFITPDQGQQLTRGFTHQVDGVRSHVYSKVPFLELLAQPGVEGIRFFFAQRDDQPALVAAGTDADGRRLPAGSIFVDDGDACPPWCPGTLAPRQDVSRAGAIVDADEARQLTRNFRGSQAGVRSFLYSADLFRQLLGQDGAEGLRVHYGVDPAGRPALVFAATDQQGEPLPKGLLVDDGEDCPPHCPGS